MQQGTLEQLPFADASFDVVWCNGVLQHAANPEACLDELARVLKPNGRAWIYVYGAGGVYWYAVRHFRAWFRDVDSEQLISILQLAGLEPRYVAEYLDDWKVSYLRAYRAEPVTARLRELGFAKVAALPAGVPYDTNHRNTKWPSERPWLGEGDLRFLVEKSATPTTERTPLGGDDCFDDGAFAPEVHARYGGAFEAIGQAVAGRPVVAALAAARIQRAIRDRFSLAVPLDNDAISAELEATRALVTSLTLDRAVSARRA